jgi:hypothetical protein
MKRKSPYQVELKKQKQEHPTIPEKYIRQISKDHVALKDKGKRNYG